MTTDDNRPCSRCDFVEEYYGHRCRNCGRFYPDGCAPWDEERDEDDGDDRGAETFMACAADVAFFVAFVGLALLMLTWILYLAGL